MLQAMQDPVPLLYVPAAHGLQVTVLNRPVAWHVAVPPPLWPGAHTTDTVDPVEPVMLLAGVVHEESLSDRSRIGHSWHRTKRR